MKIIRSFWTRLCAWAVGALGLGVSVTSCDPGDIFGGNLCYYGTPTMNYEVKGKVVDFETGAPVNGISVERAGENTFSDDIPSDITDAKGEFEIAGNGWPSDTLYFKVRDIDGEDNGLYEDSKALIYLKRTDKGKDAWASKYEAKDAVVRIKASKEQ